MGGGEWLSVSSVMAKKRSFREFAERTFPGLTGTSYAKTSPRTVNYNCIAWAAGEDDRWWDPHFPMAGYYWPPEVPHAMAVSALVEAYRSIGYRKCSNGQLQKGYEKIAIYSSQAGVWTHAARQLKSGRWTSKLGAEEDIEHDTPRDLHGVVYGTVYCYMRRKRP